MKDVAIIGTSNEIINNGWVLEFSKNIYPLDYTNYSVGDSSVQLALYRICEFSKQKNKYKVAIISTCVNDIGHLVNGFIHPDQFDRYVFHVIKGLISLRIIPIVLVLPNKKSVLSGNMARKIWKKYALMFNVPVFDAFEFYRDLANQEGVDTNFLFPENDYSHVKSEYAKILGESLAIFVKKVVNNFSFEISMENKYIYPYEIVSAHELGDDVIERKNSKFCEEFFSISGENVCYINFNGILHGFLLNRAVGGILKIESASSKVVKNVASSFRYPKNGQKSEFLLSMVSCKNPIKVEKGKGLYFSLGRLDEVNEDSNSSCGKVSEKEIVEISGILISSVMQ